MSTGRAKLAQAVRAQAAACDDLTTSELLKVLARMVEDKGIYRSFGAPGDWGYGTPIGDALIEMYRDPQEKGQL